MRGQIKRGAIAAVAASVAAVAMPVAAAEAKKTPSTHSGGAGVAKTFVVCKHGCKYTTIQSAVNASGKGATIKIKPGTYAEGVVVSGHRHDGITIEGIGKTPQAVDLNGAHARVKGGAAQNGIEGAGVDNMTVENLEAQHYAANGIFIHGTNQTHPCHNYLMKNDIGSFERAYGLFAFECVGGRMTGSIGTGNGDSGFYIGGTPFQKKPVWSSVDHDTAFENVLGYSGTNSKYVKITNSMFYDNGAGVVPNTLDSEPFEPAEDGIIANDRIFWNNFDYYLPGSPVKTVSSGLAKVGNLTANYPIGAGVMLFGTTGWVVKDNQIFGNWLWGAGAFSNPLDSTGLAINNDNKFVDNQMGAGGRDLNGTDFFNDGSGTGTCFEDNGTHPTLVTSKTAPSNVLYPTCPSNAGTGSVTGDSANQGLLVSIATANPPATMNKFWSRHPHIKIKGIRPIK